MFEPSRLARRGLLAGLALALAAPAIARTPGVLMPVRLPFGMRQLRKADVQVKLIEVSHCSHFEQQQFTVQGTWTGPGGTRHSTIITVHAAHLERYGPGPVERGLLATLDSYREMIYGGEPCLIRVFQDRKARDLASAVAA